MTNIGLTILKKEFEDCQEEVGDLESDIDNIEWDLREATKKLEKVQQQLDDMVNRFESGFFKTVEEEFELPEVNDPRQLKLFV